MTAYANAAVTFQRTTPSGTQLAPPTGTIPVQVRRVDGFRMPEPWMIGFDWVVRWDSALTYPDGTTVKAMDEIIWSELDTGRATLQRVHKTYGILPSSRAVFRETE
jgi:hypothetical protein